LRVSARVILFTPFKRLFFRLEHFSVAIARPA